MQVFCEKKTKQIQINTIRYYIYCSFAFQALYLRKIKAEYE